MPGLSAALLKIIGRSRRGMCLAQTEEGNTCMTPAALSAMLNANVLRHKCPKCPKRPTPYHAINPLLFFPSGYSNNAASDSPMAILMPI